VDLLGENAMLVWLLVALVVLATLIIMKYTAQALKVEPIPVRIPKQRRRRS
jgi:cell division protein FtsL